VLTGIEFTTTTTAAAAATTTTNNNNVYVELATYATGKLAL
jgi:hypothetical protein